MDRDLRASLKSIAAGLAALAFTACYPWVQYPDHKQYVPVVDAIRSFDLKPGEKRYYRLGDPADVTTLLGLDPKVIPKGDISDEGLVWVEKDAEGRLLVAFLTVDRGHAGGYGLLFADPGAIAAKTYGELVHGPGRVWNLERDLGGGWWRIADRLR